MSHTCTDQTMVSQSSLCHREKLRLKTAPGTSNKQIHRKRGEIYGYQRWGWGKKESDEGGQKVQTSSYKINKY